MKQMAEILINRKVDEYEPRQLLSDVVGQAFIEEEKKGHVWIDSNETKDTVYASFISTSWDQEALGFGSYPEIELALALKEKRDIDSVVSHYDLISGFTSQDPFWNLAFEEKKWFLVSTSESLLEFEDGMPGVKRIAELDLDTLLQGGYTWNSKENKLCQPGGSHNERKRSS